MAATKAGFNIQLQGYTPANRNATVRLVEDATGQEIQRKPFLDGTLQLRDLNPGFYTMTVTHPNLAVPIDTRRVRLFPQPQPTVITVPVPADLFRDSPIRDIPDKDLTPVRQAAQAAAQAVAPVAVKTAGEAIRAADWNALAGAVASLAGAVVELTQIVSPVGHDHPEIAEKIDEVQGNIRRFAEAFGRSLLELRREIEAESLRRTVTDVLDLGGADGATRTGVLDRVQDLAAHVQADTTQFTQKTSTLGSLLLNTVNQIAVAQGANADTFLANAQVKAVTAIARSYADAGVQTRPEAELVTYQQTTTAVGGRKLGAAFGA
jgi:hypothetical protein